MYTYAYTYFWLVFLHPLSLLSIHALQTASCCSPCPWGLGSGTAWSTLVRRPAPFSCPKKQVAALEGGSYQWWSKPLSEGSCLSPWLSGGLRWQDSKIWAAKSCGIIFWTWSILLCGLSSFSRSIDFYVISGWRWTFWFAPLEKHQTTDPQKLNTSMTEKSVGSIQKYFKAR